MKILFNSKEYPLFSNMWPAPFVRGSIVYKSVEHYYQYHKLHPEEVELREKVLKTMDPFDARFYGKKGKGRLRDGFETARNKIMRKGLRSSYLQNPVRLVSLVKTGNAHLVHHSPWDTYWGVDDEGKGKNMLGILLMELRAEFRDVDPYEACRE